MWQKRTTTINQITQKKQPSSSANVAANYGTNLETLHMSANNQFIIKLGTTSSNHSMSSCNPSPPQQVQGNVFCNSIMYFCC